MPGPGLTIISSMPDIVVQIRADGVLEEYSVPAPVARLGGPGSDIVVPGAAGCLEVHSSPARLLHREGPRPRIGQHEVGDLGLSDSTEVEWCGAQLSFRLEQSILIQEVPAEAPQAAAGPAAKASPAASDALLRGWRRLAAGMLVEQKLADRKAAKRAQASVLEGRYDADTAAEDLLSSSGVALDDPRLVERAGRLQRDLLMISYQTGLRGAGRKARGATRGFVALIISQAVAVSVYTLVLFVILLLAKLNYDLSYDAMLQSVLELFSKQG